MNKSELVRMAAKKAHVTVPVADDVVSAFLELVTLTLATEQGVSIRGFGRFEPRTRAPVTLKRPIDGVAFDVPKRRTTVFLPSAALKERLNADPL